MADDGETKDDVKVPDGEVGEKIDKLFTQEEKDTSKPATKDLYLYSRLY
jgi:translation initiation factor 5A